MTSKEDKIRERFKWKKVEAPRAWRPRPGDELLGFYGGKTTKSGRFGSYEAVIVHVPGGPAMLISGVMAVQAADSAMLVVGHPVRFVFKGLKDLGEGKTLKQVEMFVADVSSIPALDLPHA